MFHYKMRFSRNQSCQFSTVNNLCYKLVTNLFFSTIAEKFMMVRSCIKKFDYEGSDLDLSPLTRVRFEGFLSQKNVLLVLCKTF